ncbi:MAG: NAD-glutamate dehydrogenase, partial [Endozoicomonas sp.]
MNSFKDLRKATISQVKSMLTQRLSKDESEQASFITQLYYQGYSPRDLAVMSVDDCYGALLCLWRFIQQRAPGQAKIQAYNPEPEEHHWHSTHSVIEILVDDMPFLVASLLMELDRQELKVHNLNHPVIRTLRNDQGQLASIGQPAGKQQGFQSEALMRIEIDRQPDPAALEKIVSSILTVVEDVRRVVSDWSAMQARLDEAIQWCRNNPMPAEAEELKETLSFLEWLKTDNFLFIGFRYYDLSKSEQGFQSRIQGQSGLGTFREEVRQSSPEQLLPPYLASRLQEPELLVITKSTSRSSIQRPAHLDYLGIKKFDGTGSVVGEWRFFGLFSSTAYTMPLDQVPLIRKKVNRLLQQSDTPADSHRGKALRHIIHDYPRDEMLQASYDQLQGAINGILGCQERRRLRLFLRPDTYDRFVNVLVYVPRDRFN